MGIPRAIASREAMRITDGGVLSLIRQWMKSNSVEPNGVQKSPKGRGTPQGGVISPLLSNACLHWFETCAAWVANQTNQVISIVRYADDFVILAGKLKDEFVRRIEQEQETRFGLVVNREKTKVLKVRDRHYGKGDRYLEYGPSAKSVKKVCAKVKEETNRHRLLCSVDEVVERLNLVLDGWGRCFKCEYPSRQFAKVNGYVRMRMHRFPNRKSQRGYRLKYAETYHGECQRLGLITLTKRRYYR